MWAEPRLEDRLALRQRPTGRPVGFQHWHDLLFVHWPIPASVLQPLLPPGLTVDVWEGQAWVGVVPFHMSGVRPWWCPAIPGVSTFHETNLRTYVHRSGREPGVYFFSLEASRRLPVRLARWGWGLPYHFARMSITRAAQSIEYHSRRCVGAGPAECHMLAALPDERTILRPAAPDTLEFFLIERYVLYSATRRGGLRQGRVHHAPYEFTSVDLRECRESLSAAAGFSLSGAPAHVVYSRGFSVDIFGLRSVP